MVLVFFTSVFSMIPPLFPVSWVFFEVKGGFGERAGDLLLLSKYFQ